jgi:hypothetical protein
VDGAINTNSFSINNVVIAKYQLQRRVGRTFKYPASDENFDMAGGLPSLGYDSLTTPVPLGDPRMILYQTSTPVSASTNSSTRWWGMAQVNLTPNRITDPRYWPDGGHNSGTNLNTPDNGSSQTKSDEAPARISNRGIWSTNGAQTNGAFSNICVLGRIFDPIQWKWPEQGSTNTGTGLARISIPADAEANSMYGGGNTLRIGKFEHPKFAFSSVGGELAPNMQQSAAALLDIFCVQDKFIEGEKININYS